MLDQSRSRVKILFVGLLPLVAASLLPAQPRPATLEVDAREAPRKILHAKLTIPAAPGPLTLAYPKWIPGEHGPTGPIADLAGVKFVAAGKTLPWRRDSADMYRLHVEVPSGAASVTIALDYLSPAEAGGFSSGSSATAQLSLVSWNQLLLYPADGKPDELSYAATIRLPPGWKYATALDVARESPEGLVAFAPVSLTTLVDSPVLTGAHLRVVTLTPPAPAHRLDLAADSEAALEIPPELEAQYRSLVAETGALFGARHYRHYDFLLTLSDHTAHFGLEHHESSDDRVDERSLIDPDKRKTMAGLLPHEMAHSWNGKYRRPADLAIGTFQQPMLGDLLWVYEGLTEYLGQVLTARSGLLTPEQYRESLAMTAAEMDHRAGRQWRPLADTAVAAQVLYEARSDWAAWRRGVDFYPESELLWLEADTIIRRETRGGKSLDDFCRAFHGGQSGPPKVVPYTFDDVAAGLNAVAPFDWRGFWKTRLETTEAGAPLGGILSSGWKLDYGDTIPEMQRAAEEAHKITDVRHSIGISVTDEGRIPDVLPGSPAAAAGVGPGMKLVAVNGRRWSKESLREAIRASKRGQPVELLVENTDYFKSYRLEYSGGERYPLLRRDASKPDLLSRIIQPLAPPPAMPVKASAGKK
jgi:predicted metalloprotease with PDZ domain